MRKILIPLSLVAGIAAGVIRAYEWRWAWEDGAQGLMKPDYWLSLLLLGFSLVFFILVMVIARGVPRKHDPDWNASGLRPLAPWTAWTGAAAVLAMLAGAGLDVREFINAQTPGEPLSSVSLPIFALLSVLAGVCILIVIWAAARGALSRNYGIYMLAPVFWACFWLVRNIGKYAVDPEPLRFFYDMMGTIFVLLTLYAAAGFFYGQARRRRTLVYCSMGIFFTMITLLGLGLYALLWGGLPADDLFSAADLCRYGFALLYLPVIQMTVVRGQKTEKDSH